ncbi:hypothetical protein ACQKP0_09690 [Heyndrickxia sp. NPDC080065]|uniref:hypothetical protein n=1 Tax=Heyndrickxia sp. NPDC080065 TaxID=3390568 RepID=UPI003D073860
MKVVNNRKNPTADFYFVAESNNVSEKSLIKKHHLKTRELLSSFSFYKAVRKDCCLS